MAVSAFAGCDHPIVVTSSEERGSVRLTQSAVDAGVVFVDREKYLCLPLEKVGLPYNANVTSIKSSCDCVVPGIVNYVVPGGTVGTAVLIRFAAEPSGDSNSISGRRAQAALSLRVLINCKLDDGATHQFTINPLHTFIAQDSLRDDNGEPAGMRLHTDEISVTRQIRSHAGER
jgi:hypothetical protein